MSVAVAAAASVVVVLATVVQRLTGMGFGVVAVPLLALVAPGIGMLSVLALTVVVMAAVTWAERDALDVRAFGIATVASLPGIVIGGVLAARLPTDLAHLAVGAVVIAGSAVSMSGVRMSRAGAPATRALVVGAVTAGILTPVAALPGPPMAVVYRPDDVRTMRATLSAFFAVGSAIAAGAALVAGAGDPSADPGADLLTAAVLIPAIAVGAILALPLVRRLDRRTVQTATLAISLLSGVALIVRTVVGHLS